MIFFEEKKRRTRLPKAEWEPIKRSYNYKCVICGEKEKKGGLLEQAHIKPHKKGGRSVIPMCPNCHTKHDKGMLITTEWKRLYATKKEYENSIPKKSTKKKRDYSNPWF